jgi:DnaJ-class molecular chaperone
LLRAYIGREWDRIEGGDARRELDDYLDGSRGRSAPPQQTVERAEPTVSTPPKKETEVEEAYRVLKLEKNATLSDLKRAFKTLSERSLPTNFPDGSAEQDKAKDIHERVQKAYDLLLPILDPRLRRFKSLWLE